MKEAIVCWALSPHHLVLVIAIGNTQSIPLLRGCPAAQGVLGTYSLYLLPPMPHPRQWLCRQSRLAPHYSDAFTDLVPAGLPSETGSIPVLLAIFPRQAMSQFGKGSRLQSPADSTFWTSLSSPIK